MRIKARRHPVTGGARDGLVIALSAVGIEIADDSEVSVTEPRMNQLAMESGDPKGTADASTKLVEELFVVETSEGEESLLFHKGEVEALPVSAWVICSNILNGVIEKVLPRQEEPLSPK